MNLMTHESKMKLFNEKMASGTNWKSTVSDVSQRNKGLMLNHQSSMDGASAANNRLVMKLMNIHASVDQPSSTMAVSKDLQKKIALDDCTNYLQQKVLNQANYPSATNALANIINSNRSASSSGMPSQGHHSSKTFQGFKFNLTLNKNKHLPNQKSQELGAFYPQTTDSHQNQQFFDDQQDFLEDNDALMMEQRRKPSLAQRVGSSISQQRVPRGKFVKTYDERGLDEDGQPMVVEEVENEVTLEDPYAGKPQKYGKAKSRTRNPDRDYLQEMDDRQKIFEEEIIKRVKEIQTYTKLLHSHIKKLQNGQIKRSEEYSSIKDQILSLKDQLSQQEQNENSMEDLLGKKFEIFYNEIQLQFENLETKLQRDQETKLKQTTKSIMNDSQNKLEQMREDLLVQITDEMQQTLKQDILKATTEKLKDQQRANDKNQNDFKSQLSEYSTQIEDLIQQHQIFQRDLSAKHDKITKQIREERQDTDEKITSIHEQVSEQMEQLRKKIIKDLKVDFNRNEFVSHTDLSDQIAQISSKLSMINENKDVSPVQVINSSNEELIERIENLEQQQQNIVQEINNIGQEQEDFKLSVDQLKQSQDNGIQNLTQQFNSQILSTKNLVAAFKEEIQDHINHLETQVSQNTNQPSESCKVDEQYIESKLQEVQQKFDANLNDIEDQISNQSLHFKKFNEQNTQNNNHLQSQLTTLKVSLQNDISQMELKLNEVKVQQPIVQQDPVDKIQLEDDIMDQVNPKFSNIDSRLYEIAETLESHKSQLSQKLLRSELQEVKSELDEQLTQLQKQFKKSEERFTQFSDKMVAENEGVKRTVTQYQPQMDEVRVDIMSQKEDIKELGNQITQVNEELNSDIVHLKEKLSKVESASYEQIKVVKGDLSGQINDLSKQVESYQSQQKGVDVQERAVNQVGTQQIEDLRNEILVKIESLQDAIENIRQNQLQTADVKVEFERPDVNMEFIVELQQNIASLENETQQKIAYLTNIFNEQVQKQEESVKVEKSQLMTDDKTDLLLELQANIASIGNQTQQQISELTKIVTDTVQKQEEAASLDISKQIEDRFDQNEYAIKMCVQTQGSHSKQIQLILNQIVDLQNKSTEKDHQIKLEELQTLVDQIKNHLNHLQISTMKSDEFKTFSMQILQQIQSLYSLSESNEHKQQIINNDLKEAQGNYITQEDIQKVNDKLTLKINAVEEKINAIPLHSNRVPQINIEKVQEQMMSLPPGLDVSNIKSSRSQNQQRHLFMADSANKQSQQHELENHPVMYQGHFLEDLSEVDVSPNKQFNHTDDGDLMMFQNKTQSLGASSIMSNRLTTLVSPVDNNRQIVFNQQVVNKLDQHQISIEDQKEDESSPQFNLGVQQFQTVVKPIEQEIEDEEPVMLNHQANDNANDNDFEVDEQKEDDVDVIKVAQNTSDIHENEVPNGDSLVMEQCHSEEILQQDDDDESGHLEQSEDMVQQIPDNRGSIIEGGDHIQYEEYGAEESHEVCVQAEDSSSPQHINYQQMLEHHNPNDSEQQIMVMTSQLEDEQSMEYCHVQPEFLSKVDNDEEDDDSNEGQVQEYNEDEQYQHIDVNQEFGHSSIYQNQEELYQSEQQDFDQQEQIDDEDDDDDEEDQQYYEEAEEVQDCVEQTVEQYADDLAELLIINELEECFFDIEVLQSRQFK